MAIGIVDYGMGNRRSVQKALERVGARAFVSRDHDELRAADGLVLPGVGAFPAAMREIDALGHEELLRERVAARVPVLGICLGMQLLFERSEEHGGARGLGLLEGTVVSLAGRGLKVPHIGWSRVRFTRPSPLTAGLGESAAFYHVHSYAVACSEPLGVADYGGELVSAVGRGELFGVQFHPEKSSGDGLRLLENFAALCAARVAA